MSISLTSILGRIKPNSRKVIAVDIDEVLCPFFKPLMDWRKVTPQAKTYPYRFSHVMNISDAHSKRIVQQFYNTDEFSLLEPIKGSQNGMAYLRGLGYDIYAVTGRQSAARNQTEKWLNTYFSHTVDDLIMTNSFTEYDIPKVKICRAIGASLIIDDNLDICRECISGGVRSLNFIGDPMYPWCADNPHAVKTWTDITIKLANIESETAFLPPGISY